MIGKKRAGGKRVCGGFWAILRRLCTKQEGKVNESDKRGEFRWMIEIPRWNAFDTEVARFGLLTSLLTQNASRLIGIFEIESDTVM